jgi:hypothetical protein
MPSSILKFKNAKYMGFDGDKNSRIWIPEGFEKLTKLKGMGYNCFIPEREKKRILENKNLEHLSYYYPYEQSKFEKELPNEVFDLDSLKTIYINSDLKNILKLRKMKSLENISLYGPIQSKYSTYDTLKYEFVLSDEDKKWIKQHKKLNRLLNAGLLKYYYGGVETNRFGVLKDPNFYGFSKLYYAPAKELPYSSIILNPATAKYYEYHGKRFFVSDSIKTLKIELFGFNSWQHPINKELYRNNFIFHHNIQNMSKSDKKEILNKFFSSDIRNANEDTLFHLKFTFKGLPHQIRHLDHVELITMGRDIRTFDYDTPFVFSKYFLRMRALKEIRLYVYDYNEGSDFDKIIVQLNDRYDNEDLSAFKGVDEAEHVIIRKLRKNGVKVYYEKIYN